MIGSTLKQMLTARRMSVGELAGRVGAPVQTLYSIIRRDNMKIDFDLLLRICDALDVPVETFCGETRPDAPSAEDWQLVGRYRALDPHGREMVERVLEGELERLRRARAEAQAKERIIPLFLSPAAAGYAAPALGEDYEDYAVPADCAADFAVRIDGDSMEPVLHDGAVALVHRAPIENGDVGIFFVGGDMKCKQYVRDNYGNVYLLSLNRLRADADVTIPASSGETLCCFGKVLLGRRPPLAI
jgi:SOS-response transcriptional repressor LexA